jgi:hypothetical protein
MSFRGGGDKTRLGNLITFDLTNLGIFGGASRIINGAENLMFFNLRLYLILKRLTWCFRSRWNLKIVINLKLNFII